MSEMEWFTAATADGLKLSALHWAAKTRDACVVFCHGMYATVLDNIFARQLADRLQHEGYGFLFGHNRGMGFISHIPTLNPQTTDAGRVLGTLFDHFEDCVLDLAVWLEQAKQLGYKEIILMGHSLGCSKLLYYLSHHPEPMVSKLILASPPDTVGVTKKQQQYGPMLLEAQLNVAKGRPEVALSTLLWGRFPISSGTFLNLVQDGNPADVFPLLRNPARFPLLEEVRLPVLALLGEDDFIIYSPEEDLAVLRSRAVNCPSFTSTVVPGSNHRYVNRETSFAAAVSQWLETQKRPL